MCLSTQQKERGGGRTEISGTHFRRIAIEEEELLKCTKIETSGSFRNDLNIKKDFAGKYIQLNLYEHNSITLRNAIQKQKLCALLDQTDGISL